MSECHSIASKSPWHDYVIHELKTESKNEFALLVPSRIFQTYAQKALETKVILSRGGKSKVFNLTLMNKLMKIE